MSQFYSNSHKFKNLWDHFSCIKRWLTKDTMVAFQVAACSEVNQPRLIECMTPLFGVWILNSDGSVRFEDGHATAGGLIRDTHGVWVYGYMINIGKTMCAELWGVRHGLVLAKEKRIPRLIVKLDAVVVVVFLKNHVDSAHSCYTLIRDCLELMKGNWIVEVRHVCREGNRCADLMASLAHAAPLEITWFEKPLDQLLPLLMKDRLENDVL